MKDALLQFDGFLKERDLYEYELRPEHVRKSVLAIAKELGYELDLGR
jgi:hypothetical protein